MRRKKKRGGLVKTLTASALVAAITTGSINAYAANGFEAIVIGNPDGSGMRIEINDLRANAAYRQQILAYFNEAALPMSLENEDGYLFEMSLSATAEGIIDDDYLEPDSPYLPYLW